MLLEGTMDSIIIIIFEKYWNTKFHEDPSSGSRVVPCGQTDRHNEANSRFSQFCEGVQKETLTANGA
jgi:hypothetical protein